MAMLVKRAKAESGTSAWQTGRSYETDTVAALEKAYADDQLPVQLIEYDFDDAEFHLGQVIRFLIRSADLADHYGAARPIDDLIETLDDEIRGKMHDVLKKLKEGA